MLHDLILPNREFDSTFEPLKSNLKVGKIFVENLEKKVQLYSKFGLLKSYLKVGKISEEKF